MLSIDVGKKNIHIAEGSFVKNNVVLDKAASVTTPTGIFQGESIGNTDLLVRTILDALQNLKITSKDAIITIDAYGAIIRDIDLPAGKPKEITAMIKNEMVQTYNAEPEEIIQYKSIGKVNSENGITMDRYRAAALNQGLIESYYKVLTDAKLKPIAMDININAIDKLFSGEIIINDKLSNESSIMLIDFGDSITTVYIISQGNTVFFRQLDFGSGDIERIISENSFESEEELNKMKEEGFNFFGNNEAEQNYFTILRPFFYNLTDEIRKVISFYSTRSNDGSINQIYLFGGGSNLAGFAEYCENNLGIHTEQIISISNVKFKESPVPIASYINAIGALIRNDRR